LRLRELDHHGPSRYGELGDLAQDPLCLAGNELGDSLVYSRAKGDARRCLNAVRPKVGGQVEVPQQALKAVRTDTLPSQDLLVVLGQVSLQVRRVFARSPPLLDPRVEPGEHRLDVRPLGLLVQHQAEYTGE
jgi:hypothetical protein